MLPIVFFPDVEQWAVEYLRSELSAMTHPATENVTVATEVPNPRHERMVIIRRDGGQQLDYARELARFGIRIWAPTEEEASDLARAVRAIMAASPGVGPVRRYVEISGPTRVNDESGSALRYFVCELTVRSVESL